VWPGHAGPRARVIIGGIGLLLTSGVAFSVTRAVSVIWVNRRTTSDVRATVHYFLSQAETAGEIVGGLTLLATAQAAGMPATFIASGAVIACVGALISRLGTPMTTSLGAGVGTPLGYVRMARRARAICWARPSSLALGRVSSVPVPVLTVTSRASARAWATM
jgi:hypothetical protein